MAADKDKKRELVIPDSVEGLHDSGQRREFSTGARRDTAEGKPKMSLVMMGWPRVIWRLAKLMTKGHEKYGWELDEQGNTVQVPAYRNNWTLGQPLSEFLNSAGRHQELWLMGDTSENHYIQMCWNYLCLAETWFRIKAGILPEELDDLGGLKIVHDESDKELKKY